MSCQSSGDTSTSGCTDDYNCPAPAHARLDLHCGALRRRCIQIRLVDGHDIGQLHDAALDGLQVIAHVGKLHQQEQIVISATATSDWPMPTVSTMTTS